MASDSAIHSRMSTMGVDLIEPWQGLSVLQEMMKPQITGSITFWLVRWTVFLPSDQQSPRMLRDLAAHSSPLRPGAIPDNVSCTFEPSALPVVSADAVLEMAERAAGGKMDSDTPLMDAGVDSLGAVELRNNLQSAVGTGWELPSTIDRHVPRDAPPPQRPQTQAR